MHHHKYIKKNKKYRKSTENIWELKNDDNLQASYYKVHRKRAQKIFCER